MYKTEDMSDTPVEIIGELPLLDTVDSDIILIPQFAQSPRPYTLKFYDDNVSAGPFIVLQNIAYGTSWSEISQKLEKVPYREAPTDGLKRAWNFKGYTLVAGGTNIIPENYRVIGDQSFHAVFEMIEDISTVIHPEWFSAGEPQLFNDNDIFAVGDGLHIPGGPQNVLVNVRGYVLKPRYGLSLKGKITIPAKFNGLPVIGIEEF
jgi:hypothetical protein